MSWTGARSLPLYGRASRCGLLLRALESWEPEPGKHVCYRESGLKAESYYRTLRPMLLRGMADES